MNASLDLSPSVLSPAAIHAPTKPVYADHALTREVFEQARAAWKAAALRKELTAESLAAWALIRGADPKRGFVAITNSAKLANGAEPWGAYQGALRLCSKLTSTALAPWAPMLAEQGAVFKGYQWSGSHPLLALLAASKPS